MGNVKKRIKALAELYESERSYLTDLILWEDLLRSTLIGISTQNRSRYYAIDSIFKDVEWIKQVHQKIFTALKYRTDETLGRDVSNSQKIDIQRDVFPVEIKWTQECDLEYFSVFESLADNFSCYIRYIQHLPRAEYDFERLMRTDPEFEAKVTEFLIRNEMVDLGVKNLLYRPSVKISRYPILFRAVAKNESSSDRQEKYNELINRMHGIAKEIDYEYRKRSELFETFMLSYRLVYGSNVKNKVSLGLIYRKTKLVKDGKLIVKKSRLDPASYKHVFVFNRVVLICLTIDGPYQNITIDDDPIFLCKVSILKKVNGFATGENLGDLFPLFLIQKENKSIKALYFEDRSTRDLYFDKINDAIQGIKKHSNGMIGIRMIEKVDDEILAHCKPESSIGNFLAITGPNRSNDEDTASEYSSDNEYFEMGNVDASGEEETEIDTVMADHNSSVHESATNETDVTESAATMFDFSKFGKEECFSEATDIQSETTHSYSDIFSEESASVSEISESSEQRLQEKSHPVGNYCLELFMSSSLPLNNIVIPNEFITGRVRRNKELSVFSTKSGMFKRVNGISTKIFHMPAIKIFYDPEYELLVFQCNNKLHLAQFHIDMDSIEPEIINTKIKSFFYGKFLDMAYIALVSVEDFTFSIIHLLSVEFNRNTPVLDVNVIRKLYVGFTIFNVFFLKGRIIISCKDFEIIEIDTLRTQELLEVYDSTLSLLLEAKEYFVANSIFKIGKNSFLLCFDRGGYLVDRCGRYREENVSYDWEMLGEEFFVYDKWIVVVSQAHVGVFEIESGRMVKIEYLPGARIVQGTIKPYLYYKDKVCEIYFDGDTRSEESIESIQEQHEKCLSGSTSSIWESLTVEYANDTSGFQDNKEWESTRVEFINQSPNKMLCALKKSKIKAMKRVSERRSQGVIGESDIIHEYESTSRQ